MEYRTLIYYDPLSAQKNYACKHALIT